MGQIKFTLFPFMLLSILSCWNGIKFYTVCSTGWGERLSLKFVFFFKTKQLFLRNWAFYGPRTEYFSQNFIGRHVWFCIFPMYAILAFLMLYLKLCILKITWILCKGSFVWTWVFLEVWLSMLLKKVVPEPIGQVVCSIWSFTSVLKM